MSDFDVGVLWKAYEVSQAERELRNPDVGGAVTGEQLLDLCRRAGYTEEEAQQAATWRKFSKLERELDGSG